MACWCHVVRGKLLSVQDISPLELALWERGRDSSEILAKRPNEWEADGWFALAAIRGWRLAGVLISRRSPRTVKIALPPLSVESPRSTVLLTSQRREVARQT